MSTPCSKRDITLLPYMGTAVAHKPGNVIQWHNCDSQEQFEKQLQEENSDLKRLDDSWKYYFNSFGYRGEEPDSTADRVIAIIGCSYTFGEGVPYNHTWGNQFKNIWMEHHPSEKVNLINLAQGGAANNYISRTALMQVPAIKPDLLIAQFSYIERREIMEYEHFHSLGSWSDDEFAMGYYSFYSDITGIVNTLKDILQVQFLCKKEKVDYLITFVEVERLKESEITEHPLVKPLMKQVDWSHFCPDYIEGPGIKCDNGRDGMHPGPKTNRLFAQKLFDFYQLKNKGHNMETLSSSANREVLDFYKSLPFNFYSDPQLAADQIRKSDSIQNYAAILPYLEKGMRIADMGCGAGWFINSLNYHHNTKATGIDFNHVAVDQARKVSELLECDSQFHVSDLFQYSPEEPYEMVTSVGVLHHTNNCIGGVRHICQNVVNESGYFFLGLYHSYGRKPFLDHFENMKKEGATEEELYNAYKELYPAQTDETHLQSWFRDQVLHPHETQHTFEEIAQVLKEEGMTILTTSINQFEEIESEEELFEMEKEYYEIGLQRLEEKRYFPGFFVVLAKKDK